MFTWSQRLWETFILAATFVLHYIKNQQCLFLAAQSFDNSVISKGYLSGFVKNYNDLSCDIKFKALKFLEDDKTSDALQTVFEEQSNVMVFADLSPLSKAKCSESAKFFECIFIYYHTDILSIKWCTIFSKRWNFSWACDLYSFG